MVTKAQQKATAKYLKNNYDDVKVRFRKGQRDQIKAYAESKGESLNSYINRLIAEDMRAHGQSLVAAESTDKS